jgi:YD repeat-containing protein
VSYLYDQAGRLVAAIAAGSVTEYRYDEAGRLTGTARRSLSGLTVLDFAPRAGPVGTPVSVYGSGFRAQPAENVVRFGDLPSPVEQASPTRLQVAVPPGARSGPLTVTTAEATAQSPLAFTVTTGEPVRILDFSPRIGVAGTAVSVRGTGFAFAAADNQVSVNGAASAVLTGTPSLLLTSVPAGTGSGPLGVATPAGAASADADFFIPPAPYTVAQVEQTARLANPGSQTLALSGAGAVALFTFAGVAGAGVGL